MVDIVIDPYGYPTPGTVKLGYVGNILSYFPDLCANTTAQHRASAYHYRISNRTTAQQTGFGSVQTARSNRACNLTTNRSNMADWNHPQLQPGNTYLIEFFASPGSLVPDYSPLTILQGDIRSGRGYKQIHSTPLKWRHADNLPRSHTQTASFTFTIENYVRVAYIPPSEPDFRTLVRLDTDLQPNFNALTTTAVVKPEIHIPNLTRYPIAERTSRTVKVYNWNPSLSPDRDQTLNQQWLQVGARYYIFSRDIHKAVTCASSAECPDCPETDSLQNSPNARKAYTQLRVNHY